MNRPNGITVIAWVAIVFGAIGALVSVLAIFGSFAVLALGTAVAGFAGFMAGLVALVSSVVGVAMGALAVVFGVGALGLKPSAWRLGVWLAYVGMAWAVLDVVLVLVSHPAGVFGALLGAIVSIAISLVLLWYLYTDEVRAAFTMSAEQPLSQLAPILAQIDSMFGGHRGGLPQPPQAPAH